MTQAVDPRINDQFTNAQLRIIKQRVEQEKHRQRFEQVSSHSASESENDTPRNRLHQSMLRRQNLLGKLKQHEESLSRMMQHRSPPPPPHQQDSYYGHYYHDYGKEYRVPSRNSLPDYRDRRPLTPPHHPPPSRRSLREMPAYRHPIGRRDPYHQDHYAHSEPSYRGTPPPPQFRPRAFNQFTGGAPHEQHLSPRSPQHNLYGYRPPAPNHYQSGDPGYYPRQVIEHQIRPVPGRLEPMENRSYPAVLQPTILSVPQPYIINTVDSSRQPVVQPVSNTKHDMMEMMMLQNAQMHQMMMNQMMISTLPKPPQQGRSVSLDGNKVAIDLEEIISLKSKQRERARRSEGRRPPSVHHHHYEDSRVHRLPPLQPQYYPQAQQFGNSGFPGYPGYMQPYPQQHSRFYQPTEAAPLKPPVAKKEKPPEPPKKREYGPLPFPGPMPLRKFRHAAYAVYFLKALQKAAKNPSKKYKYASNSDFMFPIKLKETIAALHHIYLSPGNKVGMNLRAMTSENPPDLTLALADKQASSSRAGSATYKAQTLAVQELGRVIEEIAFEITEIMPPNGVLGTHRKANVYEMIQPGKLYPYGYLWQIEKDRLTLEYYGRTLTVSNHQAAILISGIFFGRALVITLLMSPVEYGLLKLPPSHIGQKNLRLISSVFIYLLRRVYGEQNSATLIPMPVEFNARLHSDKVIESLAQRLKSSFKYAEDLMFDWSRNYASRLSQVKHTESRPN